MTEPQASLGNAIVVARNEGELDIIEEKYFSGEIEPITSKFNSEIATERWSYMLEGYQYKKG